MWECPKCKTQVSNPELLDKHDKACKAKEKPVFEGWQSLEDSGVPRNRDGILLSDISDEWAIK